MKIKTFLTVVIAYCAIRGEEIVIIIIKGKLCLQLSERGHVTRKDATGGRPCDDI